MKSAKEILTEPLATSFADPTASAALCAADAALEMPYLTSFACRRGIYSYDAAMEKVPEPLLVSIDFRSQNFS